MIATQAQYLIYVRPSFHGGPTMNVSGQRLQRYNVSAASREPMLLPLHDQLDRIVELPENWDGYDSVKPNHLAVERARQLLEEGFRSNQALAWQSPYISASEEGDIVLEWWNGLRKLTIYVGPEQSTYIKSWGSNVVNDMLDGVLLGNWDPALWAWLLE